jgi:hypothetical protein
VPDDRFADLGSGTSAGDKLADLDRRQPEPRPQQPPRRGGRYTWVVGVAFVILIAIVMLNTIGHQNAGSGGPIPGHVLPKFAAPAVLSSLDGDPNVKQGSADKSVTNHTPACAVHDPGAIRSCDYTSKPLVLTLIVPTSECEGYLDRIERMRARFPGVNFLAIISGPRDAARKSAGSHKWREPVVSDDNGALLSLFRAPPYCATSIFAYRGGIVRSTKTSAQRWSDARLAAVIRATEAR